MSDLRLQNIVVRVGSVFDESQFCEIEILFLHLRRIL